MVPGLQSESQPSIQVLGHIAEEALPINEKNMKPAATLQ